MSKRLTNRRATLEALRDRLIEELQLLKEKGSYVPLGKEAAPLSRELRQVMFELESLPSEEGSIIDAIAGNSEATSEKDQASNSDGARTARERRANETARRRR